MNTEDVAMECFWRAVVLAGCLGYWSLVGIATLAGVAVEWWLREEEAP